MIKEMRKILRRMPSNIEKVRSCKYRLVSYVSPKNCRKWLNAIVDVPIKQPLLLRILLNDSKDKLPIIPKIPPNGRYKESVEGRG
ncbi:MAG: hypothetical protein HY223_06845 [Thaumarchaeota archaeon]|nr:hypothetical protein [Nitrososphaerota archaeon]